MFSLKGRIGRKEFLIRMAVLIALSLILNFISALFWGEAAGPKSASGTEAGSLAALLVLFCALAVTWCTVCAAAARLRDLDRSPWWAILLFIPVAGFVELLYLAIARSRVSES